MKLPKARTENLVEQNLGAETLIYDLTTHKAFNLNETLSVVYKSCDGKMTIDELKRRSKFTEDFIYLALDELKQNDLLAKDGDYLSPFADTSRREVIKKVGLATMLALPLIAGLVAPTAVHASSGLTQGNPPSTVFGNACQTSLECSSGLDCDSRYGICCRPGINKNYVLPPGGSYTTDGFDTVIRGSAIPDSETDFCQNQVACCAGGMSTGTCTYTPVNSTVEPNPFLDNYYAECTCTCP
jgi:hypothetical protein